MQEVQRDHFESNFRPDLSSLGYGAVYKKRTAEKNDGCAIFYKVARWQNLIPSFPWIAPGWRARGRNPRKGRDQILQRSVAEP